MKYLGSMYECSGSQLFRTITGMQSEPDIFDKARTAMTVLTNLEVTRILYHSRLAVEAKTGKKIPELSRIENVFSKQFRFINISFINSALAI